jgi:hypothetical protein
MKTYRIIACSPVIIDKDGNPMHLINAVDINGVSTTLVRTPKQLEKDLEGSFLSYDKLTLSALAGEEVSGNVIAYKAGEKYIANEFSSAVKAGTSKVGDSVTHTSDGNRVEGFLLINMNLAKRKMLA